MPQLVGGEGRWLLKLRAGDGRPGETPLRRSSSKASRVPETPSKPKRARPYTGNLTGRADVLNRLPETAWTPAYDGDGEPRDGVDVAELTAEPDRMAGAHARHRPPRSAAPGAQLRRSNVTGGGLPASPLTPAAGNCPAETAAPPPRLRRRPHPLRPKTSAWPTCRSTTPHPTRSGWLSFSSPATVTWTQTLSLSGPLRSPNPRRCACGCCHYRAPDPDPGGEPSYSWTGAGPGRQGWPSP
jgi:hypothetical protein